MITTSEPPTSLSSQAQSNATEWAAGKYIEDYATTVLTPVEVQIFIRYHEKLAGRVLDIGCGAGRVLAYLLMIGAQAHGIDLAPAMVEHCRRSVPGAHVQVGDARQVKDLVSGAFDVVIAPDNLVDVFNHAERRRLFSDIRDVLAPNGLLIFSSHDLGWAQRNPGPREWEQPTAGQSMRKLLHTSPAGLVQAVRNRREKAVNRRRLGPLQERHDEYAVINDFPHNYSLLHYYIRSDAQKRQLEDLGYELVEILAANGQTVDPGASGNTDSLHYIARVA